MDWNTKKMWTTAAASLVAVTSVLNAVDDAQVRNLENRVGALEQKKGANGMINPSGRPQVNDGADLFITADLLYWKSHVNGLPLAVESQSPTSLAGDKDVKDLNFKWDFGFRVGLGYNIPHDGWDLYLNWTRFYNHAHKSVETDGDEFLYPSFFSADGLTDAAGTHASFHEIEGRWHLHLNILDLDLGREFFVCKWLTLRPHMGLRTAWIKQKLKTESEGLLASSGAVSNSAFEYELEAKNKYWGLGLLAGLDTQWGLGHGWSIYGNAAFSLLYGFFSIDAEEEYRTTASGSETTTLDVDDHYHADRAIADMALGLRWDHMFDHDRYHLGIQAGWEHHLFFGQNQFMRFVDDAAPGVLLSNQGDLMITGWILNARFDF